MVEDFQKVLNELNQDAHIWECKGAKLFFKCKSHYQNNSITKQIILRIREKKN